MVRGKVARLLAMLALGLSLVISGCAGESAEPIAPGQTEQAPGQTTAPTPTETEEAPEVVLRIGLNADPPKLDPHQSTSLYDRQVFQSIFDKLVDIDENLNIVPMLAESWDVSPDGLTYTFSLRQGVKFHDGTDFNAEAVKYNFDRMFDPEINSPRRGEINMVSEVTVIDPYTVEIQLEQPYAGLLYVLSDRAGMIVSPQAAEATGLDFLENPVGTGPFKFESRIKGDQIVLVKNESYWQPGLPKASRLIYKAVPDENVKLVNLQSGDLDIIDTVPAKQVPQLKDDPRLQISIGPGLQYQGIWLNVTKPPLDNKLVRQAIDAAIDREALVQLVFGEVAAPGHTPFAPGTPLNPGTGVPARDLDKARALLNEAGVADISVSLKVQNTPVAQQVAQVVQNFLADVGITVNIDVLEFGHLLEDLNNKNFDLAQVGWSGRPDPDGNIYNFLHTGMANNYAGFSHPRVDELLNEARVPTTLAERKPLYDEVVAIAHEEVPHLYLWHPLEVKAFGPTVEGFTPVADGLIRTAHLTKK